MSGDEMFFGGIGIGLAIGGTGLIQILGLLIAGGFCLHRILSGARHG